MARNTTSFAVRFGKAAFYRRKVMSISAVAALAFGVVNAAPPAVAYQEPVTLSNRWTMSIRGASDSTPAIGSDGAIYFGSFAGQFWAVTSTGKQKWVFETKQLAYSNREIRSSPALDEANDAIYFGCRDNRLYALSRDGKLKWGFETGAWVDSSPAIGVDGTVYVGSWDKKLYAIDKAGQKKWEFATGGEIVSSPAIAPDGTIYFGSHDGKLYALTSAGAKLWEYSAGAPVISSPAIAADGTVYITSVNGLFFAVGADGQLRWKLHTGGITGSSPVVGEEGTIYVGVNNGIWTISADGKKHWEQPAVARQVEELVLASPVVLQNQGLCVVSRYGMLQQWDAQHVAVAKYYLYGAGHATPAIGSDGTIYITGTFTNLHAISASAKPGAGPWPRFRADSMNTGRAKK